MKTIPVALQTHLDLMVTSTTFLLRIVKNVGAEGATPAPIGFCGLDKNLTYNDGDGAVVYSASDGFDLSNLSSTNDLSVDNAEASILIPADELGVITLADINGGRYDGATYKVYRVNYRDLTTGRHEIMMTGTVGRAKVKGGLACFAELRSLSQQLKQSCGSVWSLTCRAPVFGLNTGREPCPFNLTGEWVNCTVTALDGTESDRVFYVTDLAQADNYFAPGAIQWLTGNNTGLTDEIESQVAVGSPAVDYVSLRFPARFVVQVGDTAKVRRDCDRTFTTCQALLGTTAPLAFRGEPHIPVGDQTALQAPNALRPQNNSSRVVDDTGYIPPDDSDLGLVTNGTFETGTLTGWTDITGDGGWSVVSSNPYAGTYCLKFDPAASTSLTGRGRLQNSREVEVALSAYVYASAFIKSGGSTSVASVTLVIDGQGSNGTGNVTATDWAQSNLASGRNVTYNALLKRDAYVILEASCPDLVTPIYFDNVRLGL